MTTLCVVTHAITAGTCDAVHYDRPHFTDEETKAQRGWLAGQTVERELVMGCRLPTHQLPKQEPVPIKINSLFLSLRIFHWDKTWCPFTAKSLSKELQFK